MKRLATFATRPAAALSLAAATALGGGVAACAPAVSTQQEVQLGRDYAAQINRELPLIGDRASVSYLNSLGRRIARAADPRGIPYTFYIVNSDAVNAFAVPGGHVYVNRGLIERADNEAELAGVLAHEIGHVVERHGIEQMQRMQNAELGVNLVYILTGRQPSQAERLGIQLGGAAYFAQNSRAAEREADAVAIPYLVRAGISPRGMPTFFEELLRQQGSNPAVIPWFSTHPTTRERIDDVQAMIAQTPGARSGSLTMDTRGFQQFRARVRSLSPRPADAR